MTCVACLGTTAPDGQPAARAPDEELSREWPSYLGGNDNAHYSPLSEIDRRNVRRLEVAWTYHSGGADAAGRSQLQCNPIVVDGTLYGTSPTQRVFALDAATGTELWTFDPFGGDYRLHGLGTSRGVATWSDGRERRIFSAAGSRLFALDARSGLPIEGFGEDGSVDLRVGLGEHAADLFVVANTPGVVFRDLYVLGTRVGETLPAAPGDVRAFDVRTGEVVWTFRTIPQAGEPGAETWPPDARRRSGGANAWAGLGLDEGRGLVFAPTGSAAFDFYGGDRHGQNLYANSLLALDAATGVLRWHRQLVHHDLWDRDLPAPPNLVTVERNGRRIEAVAQITKDARVFVFERETGEPLFPIDEVPVPASDLAGESAWPTQPVPRAPPPFARQRLTEEEVTSRTPEARAAVLERLRRLRSGGQFVPPSLEGTVIFPGFDGGGEWGGAAFDPESGLLYVNASEMPWVLTLVEVAGAPSSLRGRAALLYAAHCLVCHGVDRRGDPLGVHPRLDDVAGRLDRDEVAAVVREGRRAMPSFAHLAAAEVELLASYLLGELDAGPAATPAARAAGDPGPGTASEVERLLYGAGGRQATRFVSTGYHRFLDPDGYPAVKPPWGTLTAIDLARGELVWQVPLGDLPAARAASDPPTGAENYGGPVVTRGGLLFIAATRDEKLRAFDKRSGELLWEEPLPAAGYATPAVYEAGGRQYVVVAAGGGKLGTRSGDAYVAFRLP